MSHKYQSGNCTQCTTTEGQAKEEWKQYDEIPSVCDAEDCNTSIDTESAVFAPEGYFCASHGAYCDNCDESHNIEQFTAKDAEILCEKCIMDA